jgi:membrane-bound ClpP family serine protease
MVEGRFSLKTADQPPRFHWTKKMKHAFLAATLAATWLALPAEAARFEIPNDQSIVISGRLDPGDDAYFLSSLSRLRRGGTIEVHLSSPGGSVVAAMKIADIVHRAGLARREHENAS